MKPLIAGCTGTLLLVLLAVAAPTPAVSTAYVVIVGPSFQPENTTIASTSGVFELTITSVDKASHWPRSGPVGDLANDSRCFDAGVLTRGAISAVFIDEANPFCASPVFYHCFFHPQLMQGNLTLRRVGV